MALLSYVLIRWCFKAERWSPEEEAGLWSRLFFSFCSGLIKMGKQKALNPEDLWDLPRSDEAASVSEVCVFTTFCYIQSAIPSTLFSSSLLRCKPAMFGLPYPHKWLIW